MGMTHSAAVADNVKKQEQLRQGALFQARSLRATLRALQVRLRFLVVLLVAFVVVGKWDLLRNYWGRLTRGTAHSTAT